MAAKVAPLAGVLAQERLDARHARDGLVELLVGPLGVGAQRDEIALGLVRGDERAQPAGGRRGARGSTIESITRESETVTSTAG